MTAPPARPGRLAVATATLAALALLLLADLGRSGGVDAFAAPPPIALFSGEAPRGAHCATAP